MNLHSPLEGSIRWNLARSITAALALACVCTTSAAAKMLAAASPAKHAASSRRAQLVEANIIAVQAYQISLARKACGAALNACYPADIPDTPALEGLVKHQRALLAEPTDQVVRWADSKSTTFNPGQ